MAMVPAACVTCGLVWLLLCSALISEFVCEFDRMRQYQPRFRRMLACIFFVFVIWEVVAVTLGGSILPAGQPYPWTVVERAIGI